MSAFKGTPGPWSTGHLCRDDHSCNCPFIYSEAQPGMGAVATVGTEIGEDVSTVEEAKANQRLIAAAPELLEALRDLLKEVDESLIAGANDFGWPAAVSKSRAAIAKATGAAP